MKKIVSLLLLSALLFSCASCNLYSEGPVTDPRNTDSPVSEPSPSTQAQTTDDSAEETYLPVTTQPEDTEPPITDEPRHPLAELFDEFLADTGLSSAAALPEKYIPLASDREFTSNAAADALARIYKDFYEETLSAEDALASLSAFSLLEPARELAENYKKSVSDIRKGREAYRGAADLIRGGDYTEAAISLGCISAEDGIYIDRARKLFAEDPLLEKSISDKLTEHMVRYELEEARELLEPLASLYGSGGFFGAELERLESYRAFQEDGLVSFDLTAGGRYGGEGFENIYTHCLIAFPEINFASKSTYRNLGSDCLTPDEFRYLLSSLYEKGYILVDINVLYDGGMKKSVDIPKGKKPLFLTIDDVTYDNRKMGLGMVDKLIVDERGYICTYTKMKDGREIISYDNEIFPILDAFVREHPDFTFRGARGALCLTGFDGILGYRTQSRKADGGYGLDSTIDRAAEIEAVKPVIAALKAEGWTFASHSYTHSHMPNLDKDHYLFELRQWEKEVGSLVGQTQIFVWPYGDHGYGILREGELHKATYDAGFNIFLGCGAGRYYAKEPDGLGVFLDRKGFTGNVLNYIDAQSSAYLNGYLYLIDPELMWDKYRLPYRNK